MAVREEGQEESALDLNGMRAFVAVAKAGSLTRAAADLGLTKSTISRRLQLYEASVRSTLFRRSTRSISLTDAGRRHFDRVSSLIKEAEIAFRDLAEEREALVGLIRVSASVGIGQRYLAPFVWEFLADHPDIRVDVLLTDRNVDLVAEGIDFAVRAGELDDSALLSRRLGVARRLIVAAPALLDVYPPPSQIADLRDLPAVLNSPSQNLWRFASGETVRVHWRVSVGAMTAVRDACLRGLGVASLPEGMARPHLDAGDLVQLLPNEGLPEVPVTLVYPRLQHRSAAARAFLAALKTMRPPGMR